MTESLAQFAVSVTFLVGVYHIARFILRRLRWLAEWVQMWVYGSLSAQATNRIEKELFDDELFDERMDYFVGKKGNGD